MTYLRFPSVSGDHIVFVADDDVWRVGIDGGRAERLTSDRVPASRPKLSPDGSLVAWGSRRDGNPEVYVAPVAGGPATRLTYWNQPPTRVLGWAADGRVVASTPALQPFRSRSWAYALPTDGGPAERLPYGPISGLARRPGGATVLMTTVNREAATWKRYRGGTRGRFWLDADGSGEFERFLAELDGQLADPVWVGDRLVFVSDHEGHGNVYSVRRRRQRPAPAQRPHRQLRPRSQPATSRAARPGWSTSAPAGCTASTTWPPTASPSRSRSNCPARASRGSRRSPRSTSRWPMPRCSASTRPAGPARSTSAAPCSG